MPKNTSVPPPAAKPLLPFYGGMFATIACQFPTRVTREIARGVKITWISSAPITVKCIYQPYRGVLADKLQLELNRYVLNGIVEKVPLLEQNQGTYNLFFGIPKTGDKVRPILDLSYLNQLVKPVAFTMETLQRVIPIIDPLSWMVKVDLKDAYYHILIHPESRRHFRFLGPDSCHYQYRTLPFGYSRAPWLFTKMIKAILQPLRNKVNMNIYIDDLLIWHASKETLLSHLNLVLNQLNRFRCNINFEKSHLSPTQRLEYLGIVIKTDSDVLILSIAKKKWKALVKSCKPKNLKTIKHLSALIGKLNFYRIAQPLIRLVMRPLERWIQAELRVSNHNYEAPLALDIFLESKRALNLLPTLPRFYAPNDKPPVSLFLEVDSSPTGWGATAQWSTSNLRSETSAYWSTTERLQSVNWRELEASIRAVNTFAVPGDVLHLVQDSTTAISYWKKHGGKIPKLSRLVEKALRSCWRNRFSSRRSVGARAKNLGDQTSYLA